MPTTVYKVQYSRARKIIKNTGTVLVVKKVKVATNTVLQYCSSVVVVQYEQLHSLYSTVAT